MRDDTRRRLERAIWLQRLKWGGAALGLTAAVIGGFWVEGRDATVEVRKVTGVVEYVGPLTGKYKTNTAANNVAVDVKLTDGRLAHVTALKDAEPKVGDHVDIAEHIHGTGRHTFTWQ